VGLLFECNGGKGGSGLYGKQTSSKRVYYVKWMNLNETRQERESQREYCMYGENRDKFWGLYETEWDSSALVQTTVKCVV
jgi:hypothetical protein